MEFLGILAFVVALLFSVMVHEFGHYLTARKFGMRVSEFFLGFGKRIWSFTRGETEFGIKAIPAGGYCRIEGMTPQDQMAEGEEGRAFFRTGIPPYLLNLLRYRISDSSSRYRQSLTTICRRICRI